MKKTLVGQIGTLLVAETVLAAQPLAVKIDVETRGHEVPRTLYGGFLEEINYAITGGLYPELIANRGFDWRTAALEGWELDARGGGMARLTRQNGRPVHEATATHLRIETFGPGTGTGVRNRGYHGIWLEKGRTYDLSFYARGLDGYRGGLRAVAESAQDGRLLCECRLANAEMSIGAKRETALYPLPEWKRHVAAFTAPETGNATFSILMDAPGAVELEQVSLFPRDTWGGRKNGLRKDVVQLIKEWQPGVIRFPGGCYVEGSDWDNFFDWKLSVGDGTLESRRCIWNLWGYWNEMGLGFYEYFLLCEDVGAEPLPIVNVGNTCLGRNPKFAPMDGLDFFIASACDLVEFANGDAAATKWGALRAKMGHPKPFGMKYLGLSNEGLGARYIDRAEAVARAVRSRHPEIKLVSSAGYSLGGRDYDLAWRRFTSDVADVMDEHFYKDADWFLSNTRHYDGYSRAANRPKIYLGEYACRERSYTPPAERPKGKLDPPWSYPFKSTLHAALAEAAMMTGFERNCDIVKMSSYSPMFCKVGHYAWAPSMIWLANEGCYGAPSYYVQKMYATNRPTHLVPSVTLDAAKATNGRRGKVSVYTWLTSVEIREIRVTAPDGRELFRGLPDPATCAHEAGGDWRMEGGVLKQTNAARTDTRLWFGDDSWGDVTVEVVFRRTGGREGLVVGLFGGARGERDCVDADFGGWSNSSHGVYAVGYDLQNARKTSGACADGRWHAARAAARGWRVAGALDGREVMSATVDAHVGGKEFFQVCGVDEKSGEVVVKLLNVAATSRRVTLDFGRSLPAGAVTLRRLAGDRLAENSVAEPRKCATVESRVDFAGGTTWAVELPAWSFSIYRLKR